jgi:hypothetical protein
MIDWERFNFIWTRKTAGIGWILGNRPENLTAIGAIKP